MGRWGVRLRFLIAALALAGTADAGRPRVRTLVVSDPAGGPPAAELAEALTSLLEGTGAYAVVEASAFEETVGEPASRVTERCARVEACWRRTGRAAGLDQVVLVELLDEGLGLWVLDTDRVAPPRIATGAVVGARPEAGLVDALFFAPGELHVRAGGAPGTRLVLDGGAPIAVESRYVLAPVAPGRHTVEVQAAGYNSEFRTLNLLPGEARIVEVDLSAIGEPRRRIERWTTWVGIGLVTGGIAALAIGSQVSGRAVEAEEIAATP